MLKKFTTGLLAITLMTGMAGTMTSFADDTQVEDTNANTIERVRKARGNMGELFKDGKISIFGEKGDRGFKLEKGEDGFRVKVDKDENGDKVRPDFKNMTDEEKEAFKAEREAKREDNKAKKEETLNTMYPEIVETHTALKTEADANKEEIKSIKDQIDAIVGVDKDAIQEEHKAFIESLKVKLEAEEITNEEAKELFTEYREAQKAANEDKLGMSDENKAKLEEIKAQFDALKEDKTSRSELKEAVDNNDTAAFQTAFDKVIERLETTTSLQNQKIEVLTDVLSNLQ